jgi:hypothetical protein
MEQGMKIVDFTYCNKCINSEKDEKDDPCWDCLEISARMYSNVPEKFEEKK